MPLAARSQQLANLWSKVCVAARCYRLDRTDAHRAALQSARWAWEAAS